MQEIDNNNLDDDNLNDYFIRESIKKKIETNMLGPAHDILEANIDYENDIEATSDILMRYFDDMKDFTYEETCYCLDIMMTTCTLEGMRQKGLIERTKDDKYILTEMGKIVSDELRAKDQKS